MDAGKREDWKEDGSTDSLHSAAPLLNKKQLGRESKKEARFDAVFFKRLYILLKLIFASPHYVPCGNTWKEKWSAWAWPYYVLLLVCSGISEVLVYLTGLSIADFYLYLNSKDLDGFKWLVLKVTLIYLSLSFTKSLVHYFGGLFALKTRLRLTHYFHHFYLSHPELLVVNSENLVDNPDQRIAQDIDRFAESIRTILEQLIINPILIVYYSYQVASVNDGSMLGPGMIYVYFFISCVVCKFVLSPLVPLIYQREKVEGDFRFHHAHVREHAESIALLRGEHHEKSRLTELLDVLLYFQNRILSASIGLKCVTEFFNYFGAIVSYIVIAVPVFTGLLDDKTEIELPSLISANVFKSMYLIYRFTMITNMADVFSELSGYTARLGHFMHVLQQEEPLVHETSEPNVSISVHASDSLVVQQLTLHTPDDPLSHRPLIRQVSFDLRPGSHLILSGPNGCGKSTLLKTMMGIYPPTTGSMSIPPFPTVMAIPQQIYVPWTASFMNMMEYGCYCTRHSSCCETKVLNPLQVFEAVKQVGLLNCLVRIEKNLQNVLQESHLPIPLWSIVDATFESKEQLAWLQRVLSFPIEFSRFSPGEIQRLHIARLLLWKPVWALMDEGLSAIDTFSQPLLLNQLIEAGISLVLVLHGSLDFIASSPYARHFKVLTFYEQGCWSIDYIS